MKLRLFYDYKDKSTKVELISQMFVAKMYIPKGFVSDGGSIPRFFCRIFNPLDGRYLKYYIQHDFIYATGLRDRKSADILLRKGLEKARYEFSIQMAVYIFQLDYLDPNITKILKKLVNNNRCWFWHIIHNFFILSLVLSMFDRTFFILKKSDKKCRTFNILFFRNFNQGSIFEKVIPESMYGRPEYIDL